MEDVILRVENVSKDYLLGTVTGETLKDAIRRRNKNDYKFHNENFRALNDISFEVEKGEFIVMIGPSGSGKSTILHSLAGLEKPTSGSIFLYDKDISKMSKKDITILRRRKIGVIYQFYNLIPTLNVVENMCLPIELDGRKVDEDKLNKIIDFLNLKEGFM